MRTCGTKISSKVKTSVSSCAMFPCQPTSQATSEISCYLGNRWQAKGNTAGRVNHTEKGQGLRSAVTASHLTLLKSTPLKIHKYSTVYP